MFNYITKYACLIFLFLSATIFADTTSIASKKIQEVKFDNSITNVRKLSNEKQQELLQNSDYKYGRKGPAPKTWWERFKEWFWRIVDEVFNSDGGNVGLNILKFILIGAVVALLIYLLVKNNIRALFYGTSAAVKIDFAELEEDIHKIDFNKLIAEAIAKKDFRKAVRLHFLKLLKELTDKNLINWKIDKTNHDYFIELTNTKFYNQFKELALTYEYVWYGDFSIDETNFKTTVSKFNSFKV